MFFVTNDIRCKKMAYTKLSDIFNYWNNVNELVYKVKTNTILTSTDKVLTYSNLRKKYHLLRMIKKKLLLLVSNNNIHKITPIITQR